MKSIHARLAALSAASAVSLAMAGQAQTDTGLFERESFVPVDERPNADTDPVPLPVGIFIVQPSADFSIGWSSNIFASSTAEESATAYGFKPNFDVTSDWARHAMGGLLQFDHVENPDFTSESKTDVKLGLNGRLDLTDVVSLSGRLFTEDITEDRTALSTIPSALEPNEYSRSGGSLGLLFTGNRWLLDADLLATAFDHDDVEVPNNFIQDQDIRDHDELDGRVRVAYAVDSNWAAYTEARRIEADFDLPGIFNAFDRDYEGNVLSVGSDFEFGDSIRGDIGIGFMSYTFTDPTFADIEDVSVSGNVQWAMAAQTTIETEFSRGVIDPGLAADIAAIETGVNVRVAHGVSPKVFLIGGAGFNNYEFENIDRSDDRIDVLVGANWRLNENIWLESNFELRDGSSPVQEFTENRVLFRMRVFP
ncbi:MAG: outer membrane beta-barrel protein [Hyphomonadaceae bacterium]|nr:outer membrane beta-barrel protein [Hyphomonadaceae bacterium]